MDCPQCLEQQWALIEKAVARYPERAEAVGREIIEGKPRRYCEGCGIRIPQYHGMQLCGFEAASIHHYHDQGEYPVDQKPEDKFIVFRIPVHPELCHECYLADYAKTFPGAELPIIANVRFD